MRAGERRRRRRPGQRTRERSTPRRGSRQRRADGGGSGRGTARGLADPVGRARGRLRRPPRLAVRRRVAPARNRGTGAAGALRAALQRRRDAALRALRPAPAGGADRARPVLARRLTRGGLFVPSRDATGGDASYGAGRYDSSTRGQGRSTSRRARRRACSSRPDAYQPSCVLPALTCPLEPRPPSRLDVADPRRRFDAWRAVVATSTAAPGVCRSDPRSARGDLSPRRRLTWREHANGGGHDTDRDRRLADRIAVGVEGERAVASTTSSRARWIETAGWVTCRPLKTFGSVARKRGLESVEITTMSKQPSSSRASGASIMPPP